jgi:dipeptidase E
LRLVQDTGLLEALRRRAQGGMPYLGASAGTNLATPTLKTTNDMPIVQPASFEALGLVPFQINPHYIDPHPASTHMGETREERIREFLEENDTPVLGLREGGWVSVEGRQGRLEGARGARLFRRGQEPVELPAGATLDELWRGQ